MEESPKYLLAKVAAAALTKVGAQEKGAGGGKVEITALDRPLLAPPLLHLLLHSLHSSNSVQPLQVVCLHALLKMFMRAAAPNMHMRQ